MEKIHGCVKKGTSVRMADGSDVPIEKVRAGDRVLSYDEEARQFVHSEVEALVTQERDTRLPWMEVALQDGRAVVCTEDHPFLTTNRGWVLAMNLTDSDDVLVPDEINK